MFKEQKFGVLVIRILKDFLKTKCMLTSHVLGHINVLRFYWLYWKNRQCILVNYLLVFSKVEKDFCLQNMGWMEEITNEYLMNII